MDDLVSLIERLSERVPLSRVGEGLVVAPGEAIRGKGERGKGVRNRHAHCVECRSWFILHHQPIFSSAVATGKKTGKVAAGAHRQSLVNPRALPGEEGIPGGRRRSRRSAL